MNARILVISKGHLHRNSSCSLRSFKNKMISVVHLVLSFLSMFIKFFNQLKIPRQNKLTGDKHDSINPQKTNKKSF